MSRYKKCIEDYPLIPCKVCTKEIPNVSKNGLKYVHTKYLELNVCHDPKCMAIWRKTSSSKLQIFNPPMDLIDYWCFGRMDEFRQLIALSDQYGRYPFSATGEEVTT